VYCVISLDICLLKHLSYVLMERLNILSSSLFRYKHTMAICSHLLWNCSHSSPFPQCSPACRSHHATLIAVRPAFSNSTCEWGYVECVHLCLANVLHFFHVVLNDQQVLPFLGLNSIALGTSLERLTWLLEVVVWDAQKETVKELCNWVKSLKV
jgi:hypothetical protein